jgi:hypothetical protein
MPSFYLDTSAFVKLYVLEEGSQTVIELAQDPGRDRIVIWIWPCWSPGQLFAAGRGRATLRPERMSGCVKSLHCKGFP